MCGILAIFGLKGNPTELRIKARELQRKLRHRGPDWSGTVLFERDGVVDILCHERLSICDLSPSGNQPIFDKTDPDIVLVANGEIYNYPELRKQYESKYTFQGHSDCEIIAPLWNEFGKDFVQHMEGMFGIVIYNRKTGEFYAARDHVGMIPLYIGTGENGERYITSELKAIAGVSKDIQILEPGHFITNEWKPHQWYNPKWYDMDYIPDGKLDYKELRDQLTEAVRSHLMADVPFGVLISGGVDSSLIAAIAVQLVKEGKVNIKEKGMDTVHSFCIGKHDSPDLKAARLVAEHLGTTHHEFTYTLDDGLDAIPECIYHLETFNPTTIRAGTPMYLMARMIKALGIKMVLSGEGADELLGGYLYFHKAPDAKEFHKELIRKVKDLYKYDLLRANKAMLAWGVEIRPPFLHKPFIEYIMNVDPKYKVPKYQEKNIEKYILRKAFDNPEDPIIPSEILWRQKEQFSDGVGYSWIDGINEHVNKLISNEKYAEKDFIFPVRTPTTKEMFWFRWCFESFFNNQSAVLTVPFAKSIACSTEAALEWDESFKKNTDESGRAVLGVHVSDKKIEEVTVDEGNNNN
jgi:asparagine synthase (glutamine-hydrolysing)